MGGPNTLVASAGAKAGMSASRGTRQDRPTGAHRVVGSLCQDAAVAASCAARIGFVCLCKST